MAVPTKSFSYLQYIQLFFPIICFAGVFTFALTLIVVHNFKYPKPTNKPPWTHVSLNLTREEYFHQYFFPTESPSPPQQWIPECDCYRPWIYYNQKELDNKTLNSTCSDPGTYISSNQKVVSFVMYFFDDPFLSKDPSPLFYQKGVQINLEAMRRNYPGYTVRLYTNIPKDPSFCSLYCDNPDLFWCDVRYVPGNFSKMFFTTWRFLPLGDPTVDVFLSRDLDSILSQREAAVVHDWLSLPERKPIHLMRDKQEAHNAYILGGLWGAKNGYFPEKNSSKGNDTAEELANEIRTESKVQNFRIRKDTGFDQRILRRTLYNKRDHQIVAYDSYHCTAWNISTMVRPFPMQRKDNTSDFVGNVDFGRVKYELWRCPVECRPEWGKDWEYC